MIKYTEFPKAVKDRWGSNTTVKLQEFDSIHVFMEYLAKNPENNKIMKHERSSQTGSRSFTATQSYTEAEELFQNGWTTFAQKLSKRIPVSTNTAPVTKTRPAYSVVGGQASVPRYIQGIPTNMIDRRPVTQKQKIITINKDISYSAGVDASQIEEEGVKALQIIQGLENRGYRVKLNLCWATTSGSECLAFRVAVKNPGERMSFNKIAFPIAHPSMLRRIGFRWLETHPHMTSGGFSNGYGRPSTESIAAVLDKKEIFLPNFIPNVDKFIEGLGY